jgi:hypothetical protein
MKVIVPDIEKVEASDTEIEHTIGCTSKKHLQCGSCIKVALHTTTTKQDARKTK